MIRPDQIPDEVVEAAAFAEYEAWRDRCDLRNDTLEWRDTEEEHREEHRANVRVTIAAALNAWPGIDIDDEVYGNAPDAGPLIILPLPQKDGDA
jgi:hypothetical protein